MNITVRQALFKTKKPCYCTSSKDAKLYLWCLPAVWSSQCYGRV